MRRHLRQYLIILIVLHLALTTAALAHPGKTDGNGGHYNHSTGEYHYHHGYSAHHHTNGKCPYDFDDQTGKNSGVSSSSSGSSSSNSATSSKLSIKPYYSNSSSSSKESTGIPQWLRITIWVVSGLLCVVALWFLISKILYALFVYILLCFKNKGGSNMKALKHILAFPAAVIVYLIVVYVSTYLIALLAALPIIGNIIFYPSDAPWMLMVVPPILAVGAASFISAKISGGAKPFCIAISVFWLLTTIIIIASGAFTTWQSLISGIINIPTAILCFRIDSDEL